MWNNPVEPDTAGRSRFFKMQSTGRLIIVSGPSGVGKGTVLKRVFEESPLPLRLSVSATTRKPRTGEIDGVQYWFISREEFQAKRKNDEFLECFEVFDGGDWYGTLKRHVFEQLEQGNWVVLEIDVQGARKVRAAFPDAITIFIEPKSVDVLKERLIGRGTEDENKMQERLRRATEELRFAGEYDHRIVNDELDQAVREFCEILERL